VDAPITIVGAGLAGCCVAWHLHWRGVPFTLLDRGDTGTASSVAAGLVTPITGKRLAQTPGYATSEQAARDFYRRVESEVKEPLYHTGVTVKILKDEAQADVYRQRRHEGVLDRYLAAVDPQLTEDFAAPYGSFAVRTNRLDVARFVAATRDCFRTTFQTRGPNAAERSGKMILCTGLVAMRELPELAHAFQPAKGEVLTIRVPGLVEERTVSRGVWLVPRGGEVFRVGATYSWSVLDATPTVAGRDELTANLRAFLKRPIEVIGHDAATRPILHDREPMLGLLTQNIAVLNGLGSKGVLLAPGASADLIRCLRDGEPLHPNCHVQRFLNPNESSTV
jgi:glycine oxidase